MNLAANTSTPHAVADLNLDPYWMPFTHNRYFKKHQPLDRLLVSAEGAYYTTVDGQRLFDCLSGLWCSSLGHRPAKIVEAVKSQLDRADYIPAFQVANPESFRLAERIADAAPGDLNRVFFTNSGSEAVDTALKIALAYHRLKGDASRTRFIGREKGYHGVGFGGISVGGMVANRKMFATAMIPGVDHLPHTHNLKQMAFSKGLPMWGAHLADDLERIVALHDASPARWRSPKSLASSRTSATPRAAPLRPASTGLSCTVLTAICSTPSCATAPITAPTPMAAPLRTVHA